MQCLFHSDQLHNQSAAPYFWLTLWCGSKFSIWCDFPAVSILIVKPNAYIGLNWLHHKSRKANFIRWHTANIDWEAM